MTDKELPLFLKPARFAKLIDVGRSKIYDMIHRKEIHAVKVGGSLRIHVSELERLKAQEMAD